MITTGIGCGAKTIKIVILKDLKIIGKNLVLAELSTRNAANQVYGEVVKTAGIGKEDIQKISSQALEEKKLSLQVVSYGSEYRYKENQLSSTQYQNTR